MDIARSYSDEKLYSLLTNIKDQNGRMLDVLQLLLMSADDSNKQHKDLLSGITELLVGHEVLLSGQKEINSKLDTIIEIIASLRKDFEDFKSEQRDLEEKIKLMIIKLNNIEKSIPDEEIADYRELAKSLYINWDSLDELTRKFIPLAEYLYSKLQKYDMADYSPVILELCRAIENEFLLKIFKKYTMDLIHRQGKGLNPAVDAVDVRLGRGVDIMAPEMV